MQRGDRLKGAEGASGSGRVELELPSWAVSGRLASLGSLSVLQLQGNKGVGTEDSTQTQTGLCELTLTPFRLTCSPSGGAKGKKV